MQTLLITARRSCGIDHPADMSNQAEGGDPSSIEWEQIASSAVHCDQKSDVITPRSHQNLTHIMSNALASRPQNQSNISANVSYHGNQTQFGQRRRDELLEHGSVVEECLISKRISYPGIAQLPPCRFPLYERLRRLMRIWHQQRCHNVSFQGLTRQRTGMKVLLRSHLERVPRKQAQLFPQPT